MLNTALAVENILVVKLGGGAGLDIAASCDDLSRLAQNRPIVVVHGVSDLANQMCVEAGIPVRTITTPTGHSSRYTDLQTRAVYVQAAESANRELVERLNELGVDAVGLSGDDTLIHGERKSAIRAVVEGRVRVIRDDYSGSINGVDSDRLLELLEQGRTPVIAPMALSADGLLNVDGDRAAAAVAVALRAEELVILSNVRGLYRSFGDKNSFVHQVSTGQLETAMEWAQGRMKRKVLGAGEALAGGVRRVVISDGRTINPVQQALAGAGTVFSR